MASGASNWLRKNNIDDGASRVFLSLDIDTQDSIRKMGTVHKCSNPSATLMKRIHEVAGYVQLKSQESSWSQEPLWKRHRSYLTQRTPPKEIVLFFRGEATRLGSRKKHGTDLPTETFTQNLMSFAELLAAPLEKKGFRVLVFADLMGDASRLGEVNQQLREGFGDAFLEGRIFPDLRGLNQMGSFLSSWDQLCHWLKVQQKLDAVEGVYVLRADVQLLQMGLSEWPKNQMCFLWKTTWMNFTHSVNDILFYVNQGVFSEFRQAMREP